MELWTMHLTHKRRQQQIAGIGVLQDNFRSPSLPSICDDYGNIGSTSRLFRCTLAMETYGEETHGFLDAPSAMWFCTSILFTTFMSQKSDSKRQGQGKATRSGGEQP